MEIVIRELNLEEDLPTVLQLNNQYESVPIDLKFFKQMLTAQKQAKVVKQVVLERDNKLTGFAFMFSGSPIAPAGFLFQRIVVDMQCQKQGVGRILESVLWQYIQDIKPKGISTLVNETNPESKKWAERHGFTEQEIAFESVLDLTSQDLSDVEETLKTYEEKGFSFKSIDYYPGEERFETICELFRSIAKEVPASYGNSAEIEKETVASLLKSVPSENVILAAQNDRLVGITLMNERVKNEEMYNSFTGTVADMRGQGIAYALKLQAVKLCIESGYTRMRANNSSINFPMLAVNKKMGFVRQPGKWILTKPLEW
ncbi:GNAT family N-acetyltransferase [Neobacillus sp. NRS-1170]|uniref:GNAT family N-acetyltransferase n=1 Tax=Neobacillus sp. NRS-1170 TaxID=3233898 RepID=UPI003D284C00